MGQKESGSENRKPLFCLNTQKNGSVLPQVMQGSFTKKEGGSIVFAYDPVPYLQLTYCEERGSGNNRLVPLLSYLAEEEISVVLAGLHQPDKGLYAVTSLALAEVSTPRYSSPKMTPESLNAVISRLKTEDPVERDEAGEEELPLLQTLEEIESYYRICHHTMSRWQSRAMKRNLAIAKNGPRHQIVHAQTTLRYLANIDWEPKPLRVADPEEVEEALNRTLVGMEPVKARFRQILGMIRRTGDYSGKAGILLVGPAGTGKTEIVKTFATLLRAMTVWIDFSQEGTCVESICGSHRQYENGFPGAVATGMLTARSARVVLVVNEIDKATRAKPGGEDAGMSDTLLSLLDRQGFRDNLLEEFLPLDQVFTIATCNDLNALSKPLRDRFHIIEVSGYTRAEKKEIWKRSILPSALKLAKMKSDQLALSDEALETLVREYEVEPGVRSLKRYAERFTEVMEDYLNAKGEEYTHIFGKSELRKLLGPGKMLRETDSSSPGEINTFVVAGGLAYPYRVEACAMAGNGNLRILGPGAESQRDYIRVAYDCIRSTLGQDFSDQDISIFLPSPPCEMGMNPVGCAAYAALYSLVSNVDLQPRYTAFIGGIDLHGNLSIRESDILPILNSLRESRVETLYAPLGVSHLIAAYGAAPDIKLNLIEAENASDLLSLAVCMG